MDSIEQDRRTLAAYNAEIAARNRDGGIVAILGGVLLIPFYLWITVSLFPVPLGMGIVMAICAGGFSMGLIARLIITIGFRDLNRLAAERAALRIRLAAKEREVEQYDRIIEAAER